MPAAPPSRPVDRTLTRATEEPAKGGRGAQIRLPWWGLALAVMTFVVLLVVMAGPSHAAERAGAPDSFSRIVEFLRQALLSAS